MYAYLCLIPSMIKFEIIVRIFMSQKISGKSINDELGNSFVTMTANFQRLSASEVLVVQGILKDMEVDIVNKLQENPDMSEWRKSRYNALLAQTKNQIQAVYGSITDHHQKFLADTAQSAGKATEQIFNAIGVPLQNVIVSPEQWKSLASRSLIEGAPSAAWWAKQSQSLQDAFVQQMRIGYASGESIQQLVARVRGTSTGKKHTYIIDGKKKVYTQFQGGIMDIGTRQAEALVRTSIQQIAADAKMEMFRLNEDIIKGVMWLATLDSRTTPLCRARDGLLYTLSGQPVDHEQSFLAGPPAHWNCRSTLVPVTKSFEELEETPGITVQYLEGLGQGTRASMNGQVPAALTFDSWFNALPEHDQKSFLGPKKWEIWKKAGLNFQDMVDQRGNPLTLQQLADAYGFKIQQSVLSGIPNVPKQMVSALAVEQQAQILASREAEAELVKAKQALQDIADSQDVLIKQVYDTHVEYIKQKDAREALAFIQDQVQIEQKALSLFKETEDNIASVLSSNEPSTFLYIIGKERSIALDQVEKTLLPSQKLVAFKKNLQQLKEANDAIKSSFMLEKKNNVFLEDLELRWKNHLSSRGVTPPIWDMNAYMKDFHDFIAKQEAQALAKLTTTASNVVENAIYSKALQEAKSSIPQGLTGSTIKMAEHYDKLVIEMLAEEKEASEMLEAWMTDFGREQALILAKAENQSLVLASDLLEKAKEKFLELDHSAYKKLEEIAKSFDPVIVKAYDAVKYGSFDNHYSMYLKYEEALAAAQTELAKAGWEAIQAVVGSHKLEGSILKIGTKQFDVMDSKELADFKKYKAMHLSKYKQAVIAGKKPAPAHKFIFDNLSKEEKELFEDNLAKVLSKKEGFAVTSNAVPEPGVLHLSQMEKYGGRRGSNEGGFYKDKTTGIEYYVKFPASEDIARNELLAAKLYQKAGIDVPELTLIQDGSRVGIASKIKPGLRVSSPQDLAKALGSGSGYAVDAWLANWDVVGLGYDNLLLTEAGTAFRVDVGGALRYRAQGSLKGKVFGEIVSELESLRDPAINPNSANVFKTLKQADLEEGVRKVLAISDDDIRSIVASYGPLDMKINCDLADLLIARKNYLAAKFPHLLKSSVAEAVPKARGIVSKSVFDLVREGRGNGYAIPADAEDIEDQNILAWFEKDEQGNEYTGIKFKLRPQAADRIKSVLAFERIKYTDLLSEGYIDRFQEHMDNFCEKLFEYIDGGKEDFLPAAKDRLLAYYSSMFDVEDMENAEISRFVQACAPVIKSIEEGDFLSKDWRESFYSALNVYNKYYRPEIKVYGSVGKLSFSQKKGTFFCCDIKNGHLTRTTRPLVGKGMPSGVFGSFLEASDSDASCIRLWLENAQAVNNQVEILVKGASTDSIAKAMQIVEKEFGISVQPPTADYSEYQYLRMIARNKGYWSLLDDLDELDRNHVSLADRLSVAKKRVLEALDISDTSELIGYDPAGKYESFGTGFRHFYMPHVRGDEDWDSFKENFCLYHEHTSLTKDIVDSVDAILNSGGKLVPTEDRLRFGFSWGGMSPLQDMRSGGADYAFVRLRERDNVHGYSGFVWKADILDRLDSISYPDDVFGATIDNMHRERGVTSLKNKRLVADNSLNETMFKNGLSIFDSLDRFLVPSKAHAEALLAVLQKHGFDSNWIDGRPLKSIIYITSNNLSLGEIE